jgi:hypothetical protein
MNVAGEVRDELNNRIDPYFSVKQLCETLGMEKKKKIYRAIHRFKNGGYIDTNEQRGHYKIIKPISSPQRKSVYNADEKRDIIIATLNELGLDLKSRLTYEHRKILANKIEVQPQSVPVYMAKIRNKYGTNNIPEIKEKQKIDLYQCCIENGLTRKMPNLEEGCCNKFIQILKHNIPIGGGGMIIGTPTAFCASEHQSNNELLTDNLKVAIVLELVTDTIPTIVIGNAINQQKANIKAMHWKNNNATSDYNVYVDIVDKYGYFQYVSEFAKRNPFAKVLLMTSGQWGFCRKSQEKYEGWDFNFKEPSEYLVKKYRGLHILAMIGRSLNVLHLHQDKQIRY